MADVDQSVRQAKLRELALEWCARAEAEIRGAVGGASGLDRAVFHIAACAEMGAMAYDAVLKDPALPEQSDIPEASAFSAEQRVQIAKGAAETLLRSAFALMGGLIRKRGHDVQVSAKLSFTKVENFRAHETPAEEPKCVHETCSCDLDQDGRCAECTAAARKFLMAMLESTRIVKGADLAGLRWCRPCAKLCLDQVLAKIVRDEFSGMDPSYSEGFMNTLLLASQNLATMELPLTKRAWSEIQRGGRA